VRGISTIADFFVIGSGTSQRHTQGIADKVEAALKEIGERPASVGGYENGEWIIMDYGDLIVHVLYEPARQFYKLDELWRDARKLSFGAELEERVRKLRTGTVRG
jgi:ribosome-associated protein